MVMSHLAHGIRTRRRLRRSVHAISFSISRDLSHQALTISSSGTVRTICALAEEDGLALAAGDAHVGHLAPRPVR